MVEETMKTRLNEVLEGAVLAKVAAEMDVTPQAVNNWKTKGFITAENGFLLAKLTGYNPEWLLTGIGPKRLTGKNNHSNLEVKRLAEIMEAIQRTEKHNKIELSTLQRANFINEMYCDQRLKSQPDFLRRTAEIINLAQRR
jgi:hypothetical protein